MIFFAWIKSFFHRLGILKERGTKHVTIDGKKFRHCFYEIDSMCSRTNWDVVETIQEMIYDDTGIWFSQRRIIKVLKAA